MFEPLQDPDYPAVFANGESFLYEFQYAEVTDNLKHFDFKASKVGKKSKDERIPAKIASFSL